MSEPDTRPQNLTRELISRLGWPDSSDEMGFDTQPEPMEVGATKSQGQDMWEIGRMAAEDVLKKVSVDGVYAQRHGSGFEFVTKVEPVAVNLGGELPVFGMVGHAIPQVVMGGVEGMFEHGKAEVGEQVKPEKVEVKLNEGEREKVSVGMGWFTGSLTQQSVSEVKVGGDVSFNFMGGGEVFKFAEVGLPVFGELPQGEVDLGAKDYVGRFDEVRYEIERLKGKLDNNEVNLPYGVRGSGLNAGKCEVSDTGYEYEHEATSELTGDWAWLKITQDASCVVSDVEVGSGTSVPANTVTGSPSYVSEVYAPLAKKVDGTWVSVRTGNFYLTIWDIDGYACRWPETVGGVV